MRVLHSGILRDQEYLKKLTYKHTQKQFNITII